MSAKEITVEVAYALPDEQLVESIKVTEGATTEQAIRASGVLSKFPEIDLQINKIGIFGKLCSLDKSLHNLDRIEIYRPLIADPKAVRKQRAEAGKSMKKGDAGTSPKKLLD